MLISKCTFLLLVSTRVALYEYPFKLILIYFTLSLGVAPQLF